MKRTLIASILLFIACTPANQVKVNDTTTKKVDEKIEGAVASKEVPKKLKGFRYVKSANAYFRNDVSQRVQDRIVSKIKGNKALKDDKSRFSRQVEPKTAEFVNPFWSDYFGDEKIAGTYKLNIHVGKNGLPDIIVFKQGISKKADRVYASYVAKFPFYPAIHKKSKKPVRAWFPFRSSFAYTN